MKSLTGINAMRALLMVFAAAGLLSQPLSAADAWDGNSATGVEVAQNQGAQPNVALAAASSPGSGTSMGGLRGITRNPSGLPLPAVKVTVHGTDNADKSTVSGTDGAFSLDGLKPGHYQVTADKEGFAPSPAAPLELAAAQNFNIDLTLGVAPASGGQATTPNFFRRLTKAYWDDWHPPANSGPEPAYRGYPMPVSNPPFPFSVWPIGGTVWIGYPNATSYPLTTALYGNGDKPNWLKRANIQLYGWVDIGMNVSTSHDGTYANAPAAYPQAANTFVLDQYTFYIERVPDTVQRDHFDWGFRLTNLYGFDYRFTTANGYFSQQLLNNPKPDGTIGNKYGYDPVMAYVDLYFPKVGEGMDVRIGRYISLPDIEAQLAPNNYTYTHSLTYTYDCYTQTGINATIKWNNHWTTQVGLSGGCEASPWSPVAKLTGNFCLGYNWANGGDNLYACANSINDGKYSYNNLAAYYLTWYHKFGQSRWHMAWETWYQYESQTPNVNNPDAASLLQTNANGAVCKHAYEVTCFAPEWATVNYISWQVAKKDSLIFRNEYFDDIVGQRTGFKSKYTTHTISRNNWIGSTVVFRPELRYDVAYDAPAYDSGLKRHQLMFAGDIIWFY
jgi:Putative beta-barrel porin-2, OmpL-like. bbp2/Carboxypeptidase regulatory-like domain